MKIRASIPLWLVALLLPVGAFAQEPAEFALRVDRLFETWSSTEAPGCAVGVSRDGHTLLSRAYGMADLERDVRATPATIYEAGSVSKQFTAAALVLLALEGRLSLDDDVRIHVPELPDYGETIRIRHLLNHTSGLRDWGSVAAIGGWGRGVRTHDHDHVLDILRRQQALNFPPGREYSYSNSGYNLAAIIVSRVSGMPFAEFSRTRLFEPLGLTRTQWRDDWTRIVRGRAVAYTRRGDGFAIDNPIENVHGNGGLLTTVGDLLTWNEFLRTGEKLGGEAFVREMHRQGVLSDGTTIFYATGLMVEDPEGIHRVSHTGSTAGFRAFLARYPDQNLSVALLCNVGAVNPGRLGQQVADVFLGTRGGATADGDAAEAILSDSPREAAAGARWTPARDRLEAYVGEYHSADAETTLVVSLEDGELVALRRPATRIPLVPVAEGEFSAGNGLGRVVFVEEADGRVARLSVRQERVYDMPFERVR
jgi:CubicO group peptidase (beta-lactamase class C family)